VYPHHIDQYKVGEIVMCKDMTRTSKEQDTYEGPFKITGINEHGNYHLESQVEDFDAPAEYLKRAGLNKGQTLTHVMRGEEEFEMADENESSAEYDIERDDMRDDSYEPDDVQMETVEPRTPEIGKRERKAKVIYSPPDQKIPGQTKKRKRVDQIDSNEPQTNKRKNK
jgi:hypothetical protein